MEFLNVVGSRRSIRWFDPDASVDCADVQRILEAARFAACPGNLQPWRAVVLFPGDLDRAERERLLDAANRQRPHEQAPVWIYWFGDTSAVSPEVFLHQIALGIDLDLLAPQAGWDLDAARAAIETGAPAATHLPPLHETVHFLPPEMVPALASQETNGAIQFAILAAVDAGLGTCLQIPVQPSRAADLYEVLQVPAHFVPVWLQLVGHPAERPEAGGQRPRDDFETLYCRGRWGQPFERDPAVVAELERARLIQAPAPLPGRAEELDALARRFGYDGAGS